MTRDCLYAAACRSGEAGDRITLTGFLTRRPRDASPSAIGTATNAPIGHSPLLVGDGGWCVSLCWRFRPKTVWDNGECRALGLALVPPALFASVVGALTGVRRPFVFCYLLLDGGEVGESEPEIHGIGVIYEPFIHGPTNPIVKVDRRVGVPQDRADEFG